MTENIEVELRACLDDKKLNEINKFFNSNGELILEGERITTKYGPHDIRLREDWNGTVLTLKIGDITSTHREEHEVKIENTQSMKKIIETLGLQYIHSWKTIRKKYQYKEYAICIDDIPGFLKTIEIEKICSLEDVEYHKNEIKKIFNSLGLEEIDKNWFKKEIEKYNKKFLSGQIKL